VNGRDGPSYDGRSLGLTICHRIVERHGGSITARDNTVGRGTVFELTRPSAD
jgi:signal transduction histidine kinase